ncbi:MAG: endonuclease/exonuclease/phosphatase family protein [Candidatus Kariarchaeaceae archaeon]|jgi:endonuclease/exonuclease/phosphatase family metal-dependent hydrolase
MRIRVTSFIVFILLLVSLSGGYSTPVDTAYILENPRSIGLNQDLVGVVVVDDLHSNDYTPEDTQNLMIELEKLGYLTEYASDFNSWTEAVNAANYLIIAAPFTAFTTAEIDAVADWFDAEPANLLLSSRGDFSEPPYGSMNDLLSALGTEMRVQDDNIYTTDPSAYRAWYIDTDNFNTSYSTIFDGVEPVSFFSPSSVSYAGTAQPLVFAEAQAYQSNEVGDPPAVVYDDTDDGTGGEVIPLAVIDEVSNGMVSDRIITVGTTLWSDFDYGDTFADDITFFNNVMAYFTERTIEVAGEIPIKVADTQAPNVEIAFPHDLAYLTGSVEIDIEASDLFGVESYEIEIVGEVVSTSSTYVWDTSGYPDGIYTVKATAIDAAGNSASTTHTYYVQQGFMPFLDAEPKIMTYNIRQSGAFDAWFDVMIEENADVAVLVETGDFDNNGNSLLNSYTNELNAIFFDEIPYESYTLQNIGSDFDGITIMSRYDITSNMKLDSLQDDAGNNVAIPLPFLHSVIDVNGESVNIIGAHLTCCPGQSNWDQRLEQQESILNYMDDLGDVPIIYLGDMNAVSPDDVDPASQNVDDDLGTEPIEMVLNPSHPKASEVHTFVDVAVELNAVDDTYIGSILSRIDYIFVNQHFDNLLLSSTTGDTDSAPLGSDHVSVDVELDWSAFITEPEIDLTTITDTSVTESTVDTSRSGLKPPQSTTSVGLNLPLWALSSLFIISVFGSYKRRE